MGGYGGGGGGDGGGGGSDGDGGDGGGGAGIGGGGDGCGGDDGVGGVGGSGGGGNDSDGGNHGDGGVPPCCAPTDGKTLCRSKSKMPNRKGAHHRRFARGWATAHAWPARALQGFPLSPRPSLSRAVLADSDPEASKVGRSPGTVRASGGCPTC